MVVLVVAAFRCPGPDPLGGPAVGGGGSGAGPAVGGSDGEGGEGECPDNDVDDDQDGFSESEGDCDDCNPNVHPGMAELGTLPGDEPVDDNCNGMIDEPLDCEPDTGTNNLSPTAAAHAIELCDAPQGGGWGLIGATFTHFDGTPLAGGTALQAAVTDLFGTVTPPTGKRMLVLSTGVALDANDPNACPGDTCGIDGAGGLAPAGFPIGLPGCASGDLLHDDVALNVEIIAPPNARGFRFRTFYLTHEYPDAVCYEFRDQFVALLSPHPPSWGSSNVIFDDAGIPPSAEFARFPHCDPDGSTYWTAFCVDNCPSLPSPYCPEDTALLAGTGFAPVPDGVKGGGATGWLETTVPLDDDDVIEIRFAIADTTDYVRDSTVLIDGFTWIGPPNTGGVPVTTPP